MKWGTKIERRNCKMLALIRSLLMLLFLEMNSLTIKLKFFTMKIQLWQIQILVSPRQIFSHNFFSVLISRAMICRDYTDFQILNVDSAQEVKFKPQKDNLLNTHSAIIGTQIKLIAFTVRLQSGNLTVINLNKQLLMYLWMDKILWVVHHSHLQENSNSIEMFQCQVLIKTHHLFI